MPSFHIIPNSTFSSYYLSSMDFWNWILSSIEIIPLSIGLIIAVVSIYSYRKAEKLKATLNMTHHIITSPLANEGVDILRFIKHKDNDETCELLARDYIGANKISIDKLDKDNPTNKRIGYARKLCAYLNLLEEMCVGIDKGIYDENTCKDVLYSKVVYSWKNAKVFIEESGETSTKKILKLDTLYQDLELLSKEMGEKPYQKKNLTIQKSSNRETLFFTSSQNA